MHVATFGYCHSIVSVVVVVVIIICLSVTFVYCDKTTEARIMQFSLKDSTMTQLFLSLTTKFQEVLLIWGLN